ncbi:serine hydrolase domain-containing protein [Sphingomonas cavernae]|uniref:Class A beta-lactamase-related serine hydrolase n=1 Tax=Sphingomonas cavernae TaxID=2320861 RepID=A0A418W891_9SPHN|nr:serine hydrolase domain-containing protein [Sphingomonas cavernae]RJF86220.1 class A beta-lactamase-related serine hydrolase [Sphingomonas cavernae]
MRSIGLFAAAALMLIGGATAAQQLAPTPAPMVAPKTAGTASPNPATMPDAKSLTKQDVDTWLDGYLPFALGKGDIAGAVVVVVKDGQILTQRGFGYADVAKRTPIDPDSTLFRQGSVSKLFTWTAVMQQVEAGKIDLDADVNKYLDFRIPLKDGMPVTMRQLMTHTAGFEEHGKETMYYDPANLVPLGAYLKRSLPTRVFKPGTTPSYSNYGTALAGYIVERVSQTPFDDYVEQRIFKPLGMTSTTFRQPLPKRLQRQMAQGYSVASAAEPSKYEILTPVPAGASASSGADMARFMLANLNQGAGLMKPETARMMHDTPLPILPPLNRMELGFFETNINGRQVIAHLGDTLAFHTALHLFMNDNVGFYVSFNSMGKDAAVGPLRRALFEDFADRYLPDTRPADGKIDAATAAEHARMMAGNYFKSRRSVTNFMAILQLPGQVSVSVDARGGLVVPVARGLNGQPLQWVETAPFVWRAVGSHERLAAQVVDGKVVRWSIDGASPYLVFDRVPVSQSSAWLLPALYVSLAVLLLTLLHWPVSALIRRHYKAPLALGRRSLLAYRGVRLGSGLVLALLGGWAIAFVRMTADINNFTPRSDPLLWTLQILGVFILVGGVAIAGWNLALAVKEKRGWFGRLWAVLILLSMLVVLYTAWMFSLLAMTVNY